MLISLLLFKCQALPLILYRFYKKNVNEMFPFRS